MRRALNMHINQRVTVRTVDGAYSGTLDLVEESGAWLAVDAACIPSGAPPSMNIRLFVPFAQMVWLAAPDQ